MVVRLVCLSDPKSYAGWNLGPWWDTGRTLVGGGMPKNSDWCSKSGGWMMRESPIPLKRADYQNQRANNTLESL